MVTVIGVGDGVGEGEARVPLMVKMSRYTSCSRRSRIAIFVLPSLVDAVTTPPLDTVASPESTL